MDPLETLKKIEADVAELQAIVDKILPVVKGVTDTLGKLQPVVSGILAALKVLGL